MFSRRIGAIFRIRSRKSARIWARAGRSCDRFAAIEAYSSFELAINWGSPTFVRRVTATRLGWVGPARVMTGTPIQRASQVVLVPW